ncbi:hypothetical protein [Bradyrhizobium nitroreducens]|uniref:hypothetical protein n=1 Tax=Bradyrhizobium nitroreducens TaxID=709803 RepID=UPI0011AE81EC|nr:hypothetical protein [Bradyrhizobium nitroreducens]
MSGAHKRVLLLGPTGVDKVTAMKRLRTRMDGSLGHDFVYVDFENDFLKARLNVRNWVTFLAQDIAQQAMTWRQAWDDFKKTLGSEAVVLGLHATYVSGILGLRCPVHIPSICSDFAPTLIVSLVDDVFQMWSRTETRAQGQEVKGRPTFEQLLAARRAEQLLGDVVLSHLGNPKARHIVCATGNNLDALVNVIVFDAPVTYLSFPISAPRELAASGDSSFVAVINQAHLLAAQEMITNRHRAFISPLSIDELPIVSKAGKVPAGTTSVDFECDKERWNLVELWGNADLSILPCLSETISIPVKQIDDASSAMRTDVGWRDRRLVLQSASLAIVCPKPPHENRITRGVEDEIQTAVTVGITCNYWQQQDWDPGDFVGNRFPAAGSMGIGQTQALVQKKGSLEELIRTPPP